MKILLGDYEIKEEQILSWKLSRDIDHCPGDSIIPGHETWEVIIRLPDYVALRQPSAVLQIIYQGGITMATLYVVEYDCRTRETLCRCTAVLRHFIKRYRGTYGKNGLQVH